MVLLLSVDLPPLSQLLRSSRIFQLDFGATIHQSHCNYLTLLKDLPTTNSASSSPALSAEDQVDQSLTLDSHRSKESSETILEQQHRFNSAGHSSVHYQNHTLYQIHHHHYHHMLMTEDYHKDAIDVQHYHKFKEQQQGDTKEEIGHHFDYAGHVAANGNGGLHNETIGGHNKSNHSPLIMGTLLPMANSSAGTTSLTHIEEVPEYTSKHSRELWFHEGKDGINKLVGYFGNSSNTSFLLPSPQGCGPGEFTNIKTNGKTRKQVV